MRLFRRKQQTRKEAATGPRSTVARVFVGTGFSFSLHTRARELRGIIRARHLVVGFGHG